MMVPPKASVAAEVAMKSLREIIEIPPGMLLLLMVSTWG
jgi:hypothetical protein